jgi:hypothetical protein
MTASELKYLYEKNNPEGHFFDRDTMRFFGDTMSNFGVRDAGEKMVVSTSGIEYNVGLWELYRKRPVKYGLHGHCFYFRKDNGQEVGGGD